jgi:hypothetical protein
MTKPPGHRAADSRAADCGAADCRALDRPDGDGSVIESSR